MTCKLRNGVENLLNFPNYLEMIAQDEKEFMLLQLLKEGCYDYLAASVNSIIVEEYSYYNFRHKIIKEILTKHNLEAAKVLVSINNSDWKNHTYTQLKKDIARNDFQEIAVKNMKSLSEMYKLLAYDMPLIDSEVLQFLSRILDKKDFYELCEKKGIDLTSNEYKCLSVSHYKLEEMTPIMTLEGSVHHPIDWLQSVTYIDSDTFTQQDVQKIYEDFFNMNPHSKEMMLME